MWFSLLPSTKMLNRNVQQLLRVLVAAHKKMLNFVSFNAKDKNFSWSIQLKYPEELQNNFTVVISHQFLLITIVKTVWQMRLLATGNFQCQNIHFRFRISYVFLSNLYSQMFIMFIGLLHLIFP